MFLMSLLLIMSPLTFIEEFPMTDAIEKVSPIVEQDKCGDDTKCINYYEPTECIDEICAEPDCIINQTECVEPVTNCIGDVTGMTNCIIAEPQYKPMTPIKYLVEIMKTISQGIILLFR